MADRTRWVLVTRAAAVVAALVLLAVPRTVVPVLAATATISIGDVLNPASLQVTPGTTVTWAKGIAQTMSTSPNT